MKIITNDNGQQFQLTNEGVTPSGAAFGWASKIGPRGVSKRFAIARQQANGTWNISSKTH